MVARATIVWVLGLLTWVPFGTYYLFFHAERDQYAFYIVSVLFWIFGYWGVVGPLISAYKINRVLKAIETAGSREKLEQVIRSQESEDAVIELIASENNIPRFLARKIYKRFIDHLKEQSQAKPGGLSSS